MNPKRINKKKLIVMILIILLIVLAIFITLKLHQTNNDSSQDIVTETSTTFYSNDNAISVELSNNLNLKKSDSNLGYLLELRSNDNLGIFISKKDAFSNKTLSEVISADQSVYLENFTNTSNLSNIKELSINGNTAYTYSFQYLDKSLSQAFYLQVIWLQIDKNYYIFDIEFPLDNLSFYTNIATNLLSTFNIIQEQQ